MKKYSKLVYFFALVAAVATTACSDDFGSNEIPQEELYTRAFIKEFGVFDANHTWCAATPTQITINPQTLLGDVKVYSRTDGKYYYVAHYTDVYKTTTITFDAPRGTTDLKLVIDGTTYYAQAGTTLTVSGSSRTVTEHSGDTVVTVSNNPIQFNAEQLKPVLAKDDEEWDYYDVSGNGWNGTGGIVPEETTNLTTKEGLIRDFYFTSTGETITVYPVYWNSRQTHTLGIYYYPEGSTTKVHMPIYKDKEYNSGSYDPDVCQLSSKNYVTTENNGGHWVNNYDLVNGTDEYINTLITEYNTYCDENNNSSDKISSSADLVTYNNSTYTFSETNLNLISKLNDFIPNSPTYGSGLSEKSAASSPSVEYFSNYNQIEIGYYKWGH